MTRPFWTLNFYDCAQLVKKNSFFDITRADASQNSSFQRDFTVQLCNLNHDSTYEPRERQLSNVQSKAMSRKMSSVVKECHKVNTSFQTHLGAKNNQVPVKTIKNAKILCRF